MRGAFRRQLADVDAGRCVVIDESGTTTAMTRTHGRAPPGVRVGDAVPLVHWQVMTIAAAVRLGQGVTAAMAYPGATDAPAFRTYVEWSLVPTLRRGDVVILDRLQAHRAAGIRETIEAAGARVLMLPPYSPDYSPIEPAWSQVKRFLRTAKARTTQDLVNAIGEALRSVTRQDVAHYFEHCGYVVH
jgi:transposase